MKLLGTWMTLMQVCCWPVAGFAQLQLVSDKATLQVFGDRTCPVPIVWHNTSDHSVDAEIRAKILQTTSATAVVLSEKSWEKLQMLPQQSVVELASLEFPSVKTETRFLVQWLENSNEVIGTTEVWVYPTNLLAELNPLLEGQTLGVLDPNNQLTPVLKQNGVTFVDLSQTAFEDFSGRLAILGLFQSKDQIPNDLAQLCKTMTTNGVNVLWIQPPHDQREPLQPSFYTVAFGTHRVLVAQAELLPNFGDNPQSQQNLVQLCRLALQPKPPGLPTFDPQP